MPRSRPPQQTERRAGEADLAKFSPWGPHHHDSPALAERIRRRGCAVVRGAKDCRRAVLGPEAPPPPRDTRPPWDQQSEIEMTPHKAGPG